MKDMGILTSIFLIIGVCPMSTVYINIAKTGEWKPMNFKLFLGWSSKPPQKGTCIANPVYSLTKKLCPPNPWIIKSNLDTESDGEQKSLRTEISTVDRTTLRSLLSCTFKNPSRCCFWMAWKTPLDLSSIGALQFSARNIQNSVWKPFLLHVEKSSCCPLWKNYFVTTNWEVQWFCFKYPKIRLNSSNFSDFPMSSWVFISNFHQATNFFGISATAWNEVSSACFEWKDPSGTENWGLLTEWWQSSHKSCGNLRPAQITAPLCRKRFQKSCALEKNKKSGKKCLNGISNGMTIDEDQYFKILRAFYDKPCHFQNFGFFLFYCVVAVVLVLVLAVVMDVVVVVVLLLLLLLSHTSSLFSSAASWYIISTRS